MKNLVKQKALIPLAIFIFTISVYIHNLSGSVYGGDSGDLLTAALTKGIPHPSGYPLYTMIGILFTSLPIPATAAWKFGLASAAISSLSLVIYYLLVKKLTKSYFLSAVTSLTLAFTYTFWLYAEIVEVFSLNSFFIITLVYLTVAYFKKKQTKILYLLAFFTGLSLTNNLSILILFPAIIFTLFLSNKKLFLDFKTILFGLIFLLIGLTPYLYIPAAAKNYPLMNWGYAATFENFRDLVLRKYYSWGFSSPEARFNLGNIAYRFNTYFDYWKSYVHILIPFFIAAGAIQFVRKKMYTIFFLLASSFFLLGPLFLIYSGTYFISFLSLATLEKFFISNFIISFLFIPFGIIFFQDLLAILPIRERFVAIFKKAVLAIFFLIPLTSFIVNLQKTNFKNVYIGDNLAKDVLAGLPKDSVLLLRNDSLAFNTIYYQQAYSFRGDVTIPGPHNGFEANLKALGLTDEEIRDFKIKNKGDFSKELFEASIGPLVKQSSVYFDGFYTVNDDKYGKIVTIPYGLLYKFEFIDNLAYPKEKYIKEVAQMTGSYGVDKLKEHEEILAYSLILADIKKLYSVGYFNIAQYLHEQYRDDELAKEYLIRSIEFDPLSLPEEALD